MTDERSNDVNAESILDRLRFVGEGYGLASSIAIHPPSTINPSQAEAAGSSGYSESIATFSRSRTIDIPWEDVIASDEVTLGSDIADWREAFEASWDGHPTAQDSRFSFFITKASDRVETRLRDVEPGDVVLQVPGPRRQVRVDPVVVRRSIDPELPIGRHFERRTTTYLGPFPTMTMRYFKVIPKQVGGSPVELNFWTAETYDAAWGNVESLVEVIPVQRIDTSRRRGIWPRSRRRTTALKDWLDEESRNKVPALDEIGTIEEARKQFEDTCKKRALSSSPISALVPSPFLLYQSDSDTKYFRIDDTGDQPTSAELAVDTIIIFSGKDESAYAVDLHAHAADGPKAAYDKLVGGAGIDGYLDVWESDVKSLVRVFKEGEYGASRSESYFLDLLPQYILKEFWNLDSRREFLEDLAEKASSIIPDSVAPDTITSDDIFQRIARYDELNRLANENREKLRNLQSLARQRDLVLALKDDEFTVDIPQPDGSVSSTPLKKGEIYKEFINYTTWYEKVDRPTADDVIPVVRVPTQPEVPGAEEIRPTGLFSGVVGAVVGGVLGGPLGSVLGGALGFAPSIFGRRSRGKPPVYRRRKVVTYMDYELMRFHESPEQYVIAQLAAEGFEVYKFRLSDEGFLDDNGQRLSDLMGFCLNDEEFRSRVAILIPQYSESLVNGLSVDGYHVIKRPIPGSQVIEPPKLWIEDRISFGTRWKGTELGPLINSVNLAPGESRTVSVMRKFEARTETVSSLSQEISASENFTSSFASEFENTVRREKEKTKSSNWSAKASGSYMGVVSGSAGGGGSSKSTVKDFSETINKTARKAATNITNKTSQKVSTSTTRSTAINQEDSISSEFTNINQGCTLNLMFYGLNNVFENEIRLESIEIGASSGVELVAGTGIVDKVVVLPDRIERALLQLVSASKRFDELSITKGELAVTAFDELRRVLYRDYAPEIEPADSETPDQQDPPTPSLFLLPESEHIPKSVLEDRTWLLSTGSITKKPTWFAVESEIERISEASDSDESDESDESDDEAADAGEDVDNPAAALPEEDESGEGPAIAEGEEQPISGSSDVVEDELFDNLPSEEQRWAIVLQRDLVTFKQLLATWTRNQKLVFSDVMHLPSGAIYLDGNIGQGKATEPYADNMRKLEYESKDAENLNLRADAAFRFAQARASGEGVPLIPSPKYRLDEPKIRSYAGSGLELSMGLPEGRWVFTGPFGAIDIPEGQIGETTISFDPGEFLSTEPFSESVRLIERLTGIYIVES